MGFSKLKLERTFLSSKVARRVFLMFILSSLVPLGALAYLAFEQVTTQLKEQAEQRLHHASKATGMTLFERLSFLETDLQAILADLQGGSAADLERTTRKLGDRRIIRFRAFALATIEGQMLSRIGPGMELPALTGEERTHLLAGHTLLTSCRAQGSMPGIFLARAADPGGAAAASILWGEISSEYLWGGDGFISPSMELCALGSPEHVLFSSLPDRIPRTELKIAMEKNAASGGFEWTDGGTTYLASYWTLFMRPTFFPSWILIQSERKDIIFEPLQSFRKTFALVVLLTFWIVALLSLTQIRSSLNPIEQLRQATLDIAQKNFQSRVRIQSKDEFAELGASFNSMVESLENHVNVMNTINRIGTSLSAEKDAQRLLHIILRGAMTVINADGAALYLMTPDQKLELAAVNIDSLELTSGSGTAPSPPIGRFLSNHGGDEPATLSMIHDRTINVPDIYRESSQDTTTQMALDRELSYHTQSLLSVPLKNHENEIIGSISLFNARDRSSPSIVSFTAEDQRLAESLASQAAVALTKNRLLDDFRRLFEGLIEMIAAAIDEKSPYTGEHCKRVPTLTMMLADAASGAEEGPFKDFKLSAEERYELNIASLLHDCGKLVTPVHIVDKAKKLETILDRMDLIETRFEILKRARKIQILEEQIHEPIREGEGARSREWGLDYSAYVDQVEMDLSFLKRCNLGAEYMPAEQRERVREIAARYQWPHPSGRLEPVLTEDEVYNLTVPKGTLTPEERAIINHHIDVTVRMLETLPLPKSLRNLPHHAGAHHERMDGRGYPYGLKREQISLQGRIIGIADVFEALTAKDRPYRQTKPLSEALRILRSMKEEGQIDPDLFDLFMKEKIYLRYAAEFLDPSQIDILEMTEVKNCIATEP